MSNLISDLRKAYVDVLSKHGKLYHFDDDVREIVNEHGAPIFTGKEAIVVQTITNALHDEELFTAALSKALDEQEAMTRESWQEKEGS